jgi:hypothetical protein
MRPGRFAAALTLSVAVAGTLAWTSRESAPSFEAAERSRLRAHFAVVERELLARDVSSLTASQRAQRTSLVHLLRRYSTEGRFPTNEHFPGQRIPYFRDAHGTLCAMAYLIESTGSGDLVDNVARTRNNAYLPELTDEPGLTEWLDEHGLTVAEAARIQPTYGFPNTDQDPGEGFAAASIGLAVVNGAAIILNLQAGSKDALLGRGFLGIVAGGADIVLGLSKADESGTALALGMTDILVGGISAALGVSSLVRAQIKAKAPSEEARFRIQPIRRKVEGRSTVGIGARFSF